MHIFTLDPHVDGYMYYMDEGGRVVGGRMDMMRSKFIVSDETVVVDPLAVYFGDRWSLGHENLAAQRQQQQFLSY